MVKLAYADPPYLGMCSKYGHRHTDGCWDELDTHRLLIERLGQYDGWAMSLSATTLLTLGPLCPADTRICVWTKGWCSFKPGVHPAYAWEPLLLHGGRKPSRNSVSVRDWMTCNVATGTGLFGSKPPRFCQWVLQLLGYRAGDELVDLFPGTGVMGRVLAQGVLV